MNLSIVVAESGLYEDSIVLIYFFTPDCLYVLLSLVVNSFYKR
jgi:hypothetical protein